MSDNDLHPESLHLTYVIGTYPVLTTTFIDREIVTLRHLGVGLRVISLRRPDGEVSAEQVPLQASVDYLLPISWRTLLLAPAWALFTHPWALFTTLLFLVSRPYPSLRARWMTLLHFGEGVCVAWMISRQPCTHIHAHFIDRASTAALVAGRLLSIPYSLTAHASDIYVDPLLLPEKLAAARFAVTCTGYNRSYLANVAGGGFNHKLFCIYHGLPVERYRRDTLPLDGRTTLLCVAQLKERKGITYLLQACRILLDRGYPVICHIVGDGPLRPALEAEVERLSLGAAVTFLGALPHNAVIEEYRRSILFVLPAIVTHEGDRDGIPNVILEAMAMQLPVISTGHSSIPEAVEDGFNGLLVPSADAGALADAIASLLDDPRRCARLGSNGRKIVEDKFNPERNIQRLYSLFTSPQPPRGGGASQNGRGA